jgi:ribonuclease HIII
MRSRMTSFDNVKEIDVKKLTKYGYENIKVKSGTELLRLKGRSTVVLYKTGKLLVQGKDIENTVKLIGFLGIANQKKGFFGPAIGTDESLKGDTFGGIVVAGFFADNDTRQDLRQMGVKDSKLMLNPDIVDLAKRLMEKYPGKYHVENIPPKDYNKMCIKCNVTQILNLLHEKCYKSLAKRKKGIVHIVDLYPGCIVGDIKETKADSRYLEVGAASIIARYHALMQIRDLETKAGFFIPLGSTNVTSALLEIKKKSLRPENFVKLSFRNVQEFF